MPSQLIQSITYRSFRGESDYPHILECINASKIADGVERSETLEDVKRNYAYLHHCDPYTDMTFAEVDQHVVGYGRCWWNIETTTPGHQQWLGFTLGYVKPEWRHKGVGTAILHYLQNRLRQIAQTQIAAGELDAAMPRLFNGIVMQSEKALDALLVKDGYQIVRYACDMVRPDLENIPDLPLPAGLVVRTPRPDEYQKVWDASDEAFQDHWGYAPEPPEEHERWMQSPEFDPSLWRVAWDGDEVAGMVLSFINEAENKEYNRLRGYTENICVRRPYRKQGLAAALIALSLKAIKERGMTEAALGVDAENISGALRLYEKMGFRVVKRNTIYRKPMG